jgi:molybdate transport system substrate-binding protein
MSSLKILSGGAAQGLVSQLQGRFYAEAGRAVEGAFGAVGAMRDKLLAGEPCDVLILTQALIDQLTASGQVRADSARALGIVRTGVAVKRGEPQPNVDTPEAFKAALLAATGIYFPDPVKATAGIHFMNVLKQLGIDAQVAARLRPFPNGASAMQAMALANEPGLIGCTQVTEILYTPGVHLVAPLPKEFELATVYVAAVCAQTEQPQAAEMLVDLLASPQAAEVRRAGGFE